MIISNRDIGHYTASTNVDGGLQTLEGSHSGTKLEEQHCGTQDLQIRCTDGSIAESMAKLQADEYPPPASIRAIPGIDPPAAVDPDDCQFIVERLVQKRIHKVRRRKIVQYLVKWKGYPEDENTWENETDIHDDLIKAFAEQKCLGVSK
jgi:Chromo (CHRromatin Organisation MOdifier) domain